MSVNPAPSVGGEGDSHSLFKPLPKHSTPARLSTLGVMALSIFAHVQSTSMPLVQVHLDSGADLSLMLEDYYNSLPDHLHLCQGLLMKLYHLTGNACMKGFVRLPIFTPATSGKTVEMEVGEDFHLNYELSVSQSVDYGSSIAIGSSGHTLSGYSTSPTPLGFKICSANVVQSFVKWQTQAQA
ncbi:hypothetical protein NEOLEDRAFT_1078921 [Neolentinus lepideus HHB14362 ss-1]|uniref:Peptidase A2 domain-containing protein n=1 Tax=Neolentinus lepideus HHB14362 ss-1 TaxID=1314782 RepID=A0A165MZ39_9AGAM|nr:hypothetical protein NEOLEDRAFT_1078921 [Neolentinus lepideus HHB14362 ss-1]